MNNLPRLFIIAAKVIFISIIFLPTAYGNNAPPLICIAPNIKTGQLREVTEISGKEINAFAISNWDSDGNPFVIYSKSFVTLHPLIQKLTRLHECAHLQIPTTSEFLANCVALNNLRQQGLSAEEENFIADFHRSMGPLPTQYGGNGNVFWWKTVECAGERQRK